MQPRQLIIVIRQFWPHSGPAQLAVADLAREFHRRGVSVNIVTARTEKNWPSNFTLQEIPVTRVTKPSIGPWSSFRYQRSLGQYLATIPKPNAAIVFGLDEEIATVCKVFGPQTPVVGRVDYRITPYMEWSGKLSRKTKLGFAQACMIVADSNYTRDWLMRFDLEGKKIQVQNDHVLPAHMERNVTTQSAARRGLTDAHPVLSIEPDQTMIVTGAPCDDDGGVEDLVRAWPRVVQTIPNAKLWVLGEGPKTLRLWDLIKSLNLVYSVILPGLFDEPTDIYCAADLYVHPLRSGRACRFLIDAMGSGLCPIVTTTDFTREIAQPNVNSLMLQPENPNAMAEALIHAAKNKELSVRLGRAARETIRQKRSIEMAADQYLQWLGFKNESAKSTSTNELTTSD